MSTTENTNILKDIDVRKMGKVIAKKLADSNSLLISLVIVVFIIMALMAWIFTTLSIKENTCNKLRKLYPSGDTWKFMSFLNSRGDPKTLIQTDPNVFDNSNCVLKNYYIKTAYNCCCGDGYKNNFVNLCAMEKCIELGARCLDFEIYSYNGEPIIASSTANDNNIKETYNYISFKDMINTLKNYNPEKLKLDPMFLHFRIMSENKNIYDKMGEIIETDLSSQDLLLTETKDKYYSQAQQNSDDQDNLAVRRLHKLSGKYIIMVTTLHSTILSSSKLKNYVNISTGTMGSSAVLDRYEAIVASGESNINTIQATKRKLHIVLPNISNKLDNFNWLKAFSNGYQFIGMKFQNLDNQLFGYFNFFKINGGYSFVIKPANLMYLLPAPHRRQTGISLDSTQTNPAMINDN